MKKLNLGCGKDYREGWVNLDVTKNVKADVYANLNEGLPFEDNSFDIVLAKNCLTDVDNINKLMEEIWRILKPNGCFKFYATFAGSMFDNYYLHHKHHLIPKSFDIFIKGTNLNQKWGYTTNARFIKKKIKVKPLLFHIWLPEFFQYLSIFINVIGNFKGELIAIKIKV